MCVYLQVSIDDMSSAESRQELFSSLLKEASSADKLLKLFSLLETWESARYSLTLCTYSVYMYVVDVCILVLRCH